MTLLLQLLWLAVPVVVSGLVHLAVMKLDLFPGLRVLPIDGGATFRGRRVFGDNKTWRGAVVTILTVTASAWALARLNDCCINLPTLVPFAELHPVAWGFLLGRATSRANSRTASPSASSASLRARAVRAWPGARSGS